MIIGESLKEALGWEEEASTSMSVLDVISDNPHYLSQLEDIGIDLTPFDNTDVMDKIVLAANTRRTTTTKKDWAEGLSTQTAVGLYEAGVAPDEEAQAAYDARKADVAAKKEAKDKNLRPANAEVSDGPKESALRAMLKKRGMTDAQIDAIIKTQAKDRGIHR